MQSPRVKLGNAAGDEVVARVALDRLREQDTISNRVISKCGDDRIVHPPVPEIDARRLSSQLMGRRSCIGRVLKKRDPRFVPESAVQEQRRVHGRGEHGCGERLRPVVRVCKFVGACLQMNLKTCVAKLDERVVIQS